MKKNVFIVACAAFLLQGCFSSVVRANGPRGERYSSAGASLFWGITTPTHGAKQCPNGLREVEMWRPWYSYLVSLVTIGIVTPITSEWECMGSPPPIVVPAPAAAPPPPAPR
ncbi:MAG: hypothetical protein ACO1OB_34270 [Archangium sp.]